MSRYFDCPLGHRHWGPYGAAGLLAVREDGRVLLQHRSPAVHHGDTWAIPGGAIDYGETPIEAALREAWEETGLDPSAVTVMDTVTADCGGGWTYTTVIATVSDFTPHETWEAGQTAWAPIEDVTSYDLHPGFRTAWHSDLLRLVGSD